MILAPDPAFLQRTFSFKFYFLTITADSDQNHQNVGNSVKAKEETDVALADDSLDEERNSKDTPIPEETGVC